jgi:hypothetical protein
MKCDPYKACLFQSEGLPSVLAHYRGTVNGISMEDSPISLEMDASHSIEREIQYQALLDVLESITLPELRRLVNEFNLGVKSHSAGPLHEALRIHLYSLLPAIIADESNEDGSDGADDGKCSSYLEGFHESLTCLGLTALNWLVVDNRERLRAFR